MLEALKYKNLLSSNIKLTRRFLPVCGIVKDKNAFKN